MDYTDLLKGSVTLEEVASHLSEQDSVAGVEEEIFKLIRAVMTTLFCKDTVEVWQM